MDFMCFFTAMVLHSLAILPLRIISCSSFERIQIRFSSIYYNMNIIFVFANGNISRFMCCWLIQNLSTPASVLIGRFHSEITIDGRDLFFFAICECVALCRCLTNDYEFKSVAAILLFVLLHVFGDSCEFRLFVFFHSSLYRIAI